MSSLEITVQRRTRQGFPIVLDWMAANALPQRAEGFVATGVRLEESLRANLADAGAYGALLGQQLFAGARRDLALRALAAAAADDPLRVYLVIESPELQHLNWEWLSVPREGDRWVPLATLQFAPFVRYLPGLSTRHYPPLLQADLRALVVIADPPPANSSGLDTFDAAVLAREIVAAFGDIPVDLLARDAAQLDHRPVGPPTLEALGDRLSQSSYAILHVVAHGAVSQRSGEGALYLLDDEGREQRVAGTVFVRLLESVRRPPHFIFIGACSSAAQQRDSEYGGLAQTLVNEVGTPAVLAMRQNVTIASMRALAAAFYPNLRRLRHVDLALAEARVHLVQRADALVPVLYSRLGERPLLGSAKTDRAMLADLRRALPLLQTLIAERAPAHMAEFTDVQAQSLQWPEPAETTLDMLPPGHDVTLSQLDKISQAVAGITLDELLTGSTPAGYDARCPFPGLEAFDADTALFFFGRTDKVAELRAQINRSAFVAILGASGSGKSSLLRAGLIPELRRVAPARRVTVMRPGMDPVEALRSALSEATPDLLIIDQFEELFTRGLPREQQDQFIDTLYARPDGVRVVVALRSDFLDESAAYPDLASDIAARTVVVTPLTPAALRSVMEQQASAVGLRFEPGLAQRIFAAVDGQPGAMPLLQFALRQLWQQRYGYWLRTRDYEALGELAQVLAQEAESVYQNLNTTERTRMRALLLRLVRPRGMANELLQFTRQQVNLAEIVPAGADLRSLEQLVNRLADARLLQTSAAEGSDDTVVEVTHEALIRYWPRLTSWLGEERAFLFQRSALSDRKARWEALGRDPGALLRGRELAEFAVLAENNRTALSTEELAFVERSRAAAAAQAARMQVASRTLAALIGLAAGGLSQFLVSFVADPFMSPLNARFFLAVNSGFYGATVGLITMLVLDPLLIKGGWRDLARSIIVAGGTFSGLLLAERLIGAPPAELGNLYLLAGGVIMGALWGGGYGAVHWITARRRLGVAAAIALPSAVPLAFLLALPVLLFDGFLRLTFWEYLLWGFTLPIALNTATLLVRFAQNLPPFRLSE